MDSNLFTFLECSDWNVFECSDWNVLECSDCTDESQKDETFVQYRINRTFLL